MKPTNRHRRISSRRRLAGNLLLLLTVGGLAVTLVIQSVWGRSLGWSDQLDLIIDVRKELADSYVTKPDEKAMAQAAVRGMIKSIGDPFTTYLSPEDLKPFERDIHGQFTGIGAEVDMSNGRLRIVSPLEDSPAWKAGVLPGDIVLKINGEDAKGLEIKDAIDKLTGKAGTDVHITVRHRSGEKERITITRQVINVRTVRGIHRNKDQHFEFMLDRGKKVGYIRITQFSDRTVSEFKDALKQLKSRGVKALILDLRFNPGGLLSAAVGVSDSLLAKGKTIVSVKGRTVPKRVKKSDHTPILSTDVPVIVLANDASASASEIVTGALKDNQRAHVLGTRTFGKGSVQQVKRLPSSQGAIKITNAYYYIPSGRKIHRTEDAKRWGVDPSDGGWVPMSPKQVQRMLKVRRKVSVSHMFTNDGKPVDITPRWIQSTLKDPQLAAALKAMRITIKTGEFPDLGESNKKALLAARKQANLRQQRELLTERLSQVKDELAKLRKKQAKGETPDKGKDADHASPKASDGAMELVPDAQTSKPDASKPDASSDQSNESSSKQSEPKGSSSDGPK